MFAQDSHTLNLLGAVGAGSKRFWINRALLSRHDGGKEKSNWTEEDAEYQPPNEAAILSGGDNPTQDSK